MSGDKAHWKFLVSEQMIGGTNVSLDHDGILDVCLFLQTYGESFWYFELFQSVIVIFHITLMVHQTQLIIVGFFQKQEHIFYHQI